MKRHFFTAALTLSLLALPHISAQAADDRVRVGLAYGSTALSAAQLQNTEGYDLGTIGANGFSAAKHVSNTKLTVVPSGSGLTVKDTETGAVLYETNVPMLAISPSGDLAWFQKYQYRGDFMYQAANGKVTVVNDVALEDYIKGVVPYEMSPSWHKEALKAQAVCARSYVDGQKGRHKSSGFDVCNTTHCQVYHGIGRATANSNAAVEETRGQYLYEKDKRVVGYFFSSDGGATESAVNVWGGNYAYLTGKKDPYEKTESISNGVWSKTLTAAEIRNKLTASGRSIGEIQSVQVTKRTEMGNVNALTITDTSGKAVTLTKEACRTVLGLNSIRYTVGGQGSLEGTQTNTIAVNDKPVQDGGFHTIQGDGTKANIGSVHGKTALTAAGKETLTVAAQPTVDSDPVVTGKSYTFSGRGWGHHVGMSQYGAKAMAEQGMNYQQILQFYYTGVTVK
ncbi:MAG: SpoIID/LytB domain-containing protein [Butyricicoccus pullicaecorum]|nr:SpoIID/LytB domain-containing protein [Butyricicoccus pullicaecorum]